MRMLASYLLSFLAVCIALVLASWVFLVSCLETYDPKTKQRWDGMGRPMNTPELGPSGTDRGAGYRLTDALLGFAMAGAAFGLWHAGQSLRKKR